MKRNPFNNRSVLGSRKTAARPSVASTNLAVRAGKDYKGGYSDEVSAQLAGDDGQAGVHNPEKWGVNSAAPRLVNEVNAAHDTTADLVGHEVRGALQPVVERLAELTPVVAAQEESALDSTDDYADKAVTLARLEREAKAQQVGLPHRLQHVWLSVCIVLLVYGDLPVIAKSFEQFHLSDHPLVPGLHLTDELHLAGLASVAALIILSHIAGQHLRLLAHDFNLRRLVPQAERTKLPRPSRFAAVVSLLCILAALTLLVGLSNLRVAYLASQGQANSGAAFFAVNIGILSAATGVAFVFASPFGRRLVDAERRAVESEKQLNKETQVLVELVGEYNGNVALLDTLVAQGGQHIGASEHDAQRQGHAIARQTILAQPEPTAEQLFTDELPQPRHYEDDELLGTVTGMKPLTRFGLKDIDRVTERRQAIRSLINGIRLGAEVSESKEPDQTDVDLNQGAVTGSQNAGANATVVPLNAPTSTESHRAATS